MISQSTVSKLENFCSTTLVDLQRKEPRLTMLAQS